VEEWDLTPSRVKDLVVQQKLSIEEKSIKIEELEKQLQQLKEKQDHLQEKVNCNSQNSSIPPSTELIKPEKNKGAKRKKRKRGGQSGHVGHSRPLYDESEFIKIEIENHLPQTCKCCGEELSGIDESPYRQGERKNRWD
jgi:transposase